MNKRRMAVVATIGVVVAGALGAGSNALGIPDVVVYTVAAAALAGLVALGLPYILLDDLRPRPSGSDRTTDVVITWSSGVLHARSTQTREDVEREHDGIDAYMTDGGADTQPWPVASQGENANAPA